MTDDGQGKKEFDYNAFKRLVLSELKLNKCFTETLCCGFSRKDILDMVAFPVRYGKRILKLSEYMYHKSGYYKRLIDYFVNQSVCNYTIDTRIKSKKSEQMADKIKNAFVGFSAYAETFNMKSEIHNILERLFKYDACFAYVEDVSGEKAYYYIDPSICTITSFVNGRIYEFCINISSVTKAKYLCLPSGVQKIIDEAKDNKELTIQIPYDKAMCFKYNTDTLAMIPPFFMMIADILLIDDYKELAKAQSINDAYKILTMKIPTKDGQLTMDDPLITTFVDVVLNTVQNNIGVITTPFDMGTEEFSSSNADDRDTVSDAISWAFKNAGVSEALMSGASSGSELKLSITNDSGDIFRIYRLIENWISFQTKLHGFYNRNYEFVYRILDMTTFNESDFRDKELKMAQSGIPNKFRLAAANGLPPAVVIGNSMVENNIFGDMFNNWQPLKSSYTQSSDTSDGGRPASADGDLSSSGEVTRENDTNNPDNRI